ncbi:MAG: hypothetical protein MR766_04580 [Erysipelotrichaceae bacterium]|nr:hypothetical protein [Erysipelotrichaceae bacterium]
MKKAKEHNRLPELLEFGLFDPQVIPNDVRLDSLNISIMSLLFLSLMSCLS